MKVIVKVTAARTVIPDRMILQFGLEIQTRLAYRRSVQSRLCHVVSPRYFNVIPTYSAIRDGIFLFICSILTFPTELFEFEYFVERESRSLRYFILCIFERILERKSFHHIFLKIKDLFNVLLIVLQCLFFLNFFTRFLRFSSNFQRFLIL